MKLSLNNMKGRDEYLRKLIEEKEEALKNAPDGHLKICYSHGNMQYKRYCGKGKKEVYIPVGKTELIRQLAQKAYDEKVLGKAIKERRNITSLVNLYEGGNCDDVFEYLPAAKKELITPILLPDDEFVRRWLDDDYEGLGFEEGSREYYSSAGLRVRSKSEIDIADKYDAYTIPKKFEKPLFLKGYGTAYPDFTLLNVRLRKIYIHEHLGMLDDPEYADQNVKKLAAYQKNGYFPGKNLILTFETAAHPFDARIMDDIIEQYLL